MQSVVNLTDISNQTSDFGFKRDRADFYQDDEHPKRLWIKNLHLKAQQLLASPGELPEVHAKGVREATAGARCALSCAQLRSLSDAFENVPDPRDPLMGAL